MPKYCHTRIPCPTCPFRRDTPGTIPVRLYAERIIEITSMVAPEDGQGGGFPCHKTVDHDDRDRATELECAGALIFAYKLGQTSQTIRIAERLGLVDPELVESSHWPEVFDSVEEMLETALDANNKKAAGRRRRRR